jgi:hypothetical protein
MVMNIAVIDAHVKNLSVSEKSMNSLHDVRLHTELPVYLRLLNASIRKT